MRKLLFDIETSLGEAYVFGTAYKTNIFWQQLKTPPKIICIAYKWHGQSKTYCLDWGKKKCDKDPLKKFLKILNSADVIIGHNSDKFDIKWIRGRCFTHRLPMMPDYTSIDTYKEAKRMKLQSYSLDHINRLMGHQGKSETDRQLWVDTTEGKPGALAKMKYYCKGDVNRLEETYNDMAPYMKHKLSVTTDRGKCPGCGSDDLLIVRRKITASGSRRIQYQCKGCGKHHTVPEIAFNKARAK
jgi:DNA polymerase elongation subunit (family B)